MPLRKPDAPDRNETDGGRMGKKKKKNARVSRSETCAFRVAFSSFVSKTSAARDTRPPVNRTRDIVCGSVPTSVTSGLAIRPRTGARNYVWAGGGGAGNAP